MPIVANDWSVDRATGDIRYIGNDHGGGSPSYATVIEFHRWLQGLADDASSTGNDEIDITNLNPSSRSTDNIIRLLGSYNIDDNAAEHLYDGSIIQGTGGTEVYYDGVVNFGNADVQIQIIQNGAVLTDDWWNFGGGGLNADSTQGISHRFMIKTRTAGADVDGRRVLGTCRRFGFTYSEFPINGTSRGNNVLALSDSSDLNNQTAEGTVATWTTITNTTQGYVGIDITGDTVNEFYYSEWNKDSYSINQFFERMKYLVRDGSAETLYGISGELFRGITHEIDVDTPTGTFNAVEAVTWTGGSGQMLAINSPTAATKMWIQLLTGSVPGDNVVITGSTSLASVAVNVTVTERPVKTPFIGVSTGSAIIGGYGVGIEATDVLATDTLFDLTNTQRTPPNNVTFTVFGLVSTEDRVLVGPWDGSTLDVNNNPAIQVNQLALNGALTGVTTSVVVSTAIPTDTPANGTIRILRADGSYSRHPYSAWSGSTFTITSHDFTSNNAANGANVWISYIDTLASGASASFTGVYNANRDLVIVVRDGDAASPIKEFITSGTLGSNGGSTTAIRTSDT